MVHGHAHHHTHDRPLEVRDKDDSNYVVVYKTLDPDFDGDVGGYVTQKPDDDDSDTATKDHKNAGVGPPVQVTKTEEPPPKTTEEATATDEKTAETTEEAHTTEEAKETSATETTKAEPTKTTESDTDTATTTDAQTKPTASSFVTSASSTSADSSHDVNQLAVTSSPSATDSAASASSTASSAQSAGLSSGAKAGVAIGVIFGVGLIAALVFFFIRRKKRAQGEDEDEKVFGAQNLPPPPPLSKSARISTPPQLKVRPITQFAPDLGGNGNRAAGPAAVAPYTLAEETPPPTPPKSAGSNPFNDPTNSFNAAATPTSEHPTVTASNAGLSGPGPMEAAAGAAAVGAVGAAAATASHKSDEDKPNEPTSDPPGRSSPSPGSIDGESISSAAMAAAGMTGPAAAGPLNVYRVQMDFNPSMEDELALRTGSLVRMLHEYDDGWALCVRLDRSQQGVAPRSCLSARPVKPRLRPPPGAVPGPRGPPRMGPNGRPMSPAGRIPSGPPAGRFYPHDGRPGSPGGPGYAPRPYPVSMPPVQFPAVPGAGGQPMPPTIRQVPRSMSPSPYAFPGASQPGAPTGHQQPTNNIGNNVVDASMPHNTSAPASKPGSPPVAAEPQAPSSPPTIQSSVPSSPQGSMISRKPVHGQEI